MKVQITRIKNVHLKAQGDDTNFVFLDGLPKIGGEGAGMRPMQLFLSSLGGCASMDVINILTKGRHQIESFEVLLEGERTGAIPAVFRHIVLTFKAKGNFSAEALQRAVQLSVEKYCSVASMLKEEIQLEYQSEKIK